MMERRSIDRAAYVVAVFATLIGAGGGVVGFSEMVSRISGPGLPPQLAFVALAMGGVPLLAVIGGFSYLAWKPKGWGKLVCLVGAPWIMFSVVIELFGLPGGLEHNTLFLLPAWGGGTLLVVGATLLVLDRGQLFRGPAA